MYSFVIFMFQDLFYKEIASSHLSESESVFYERLKYKQDD